MTGQATKTCIKCSVVKPLTAFAGRQRTCIACRDAAKARTMERKEAVAYTPALAERIYDLVAMGATITEVAQMSGMPTARQMAAWRRQHEEFRDAYEVARQARADARSDRVDQALNDLRAGKVTAADCRVIVEAELKLASKESPQRYGEKIEVSTPDALKAVTAAMAIEALIAALNTVALDAPKPLLPSPIPSAGDGAVGAAGDSVAPTASSPVESEVDPYAEPGEDLGPFESIARAA